MKGRACTAGATFILLMTVLGWIGERVIEDGLFNLGSDPVGMCPLQPGSLSSKPSADQLAGFAYVIEIFGEL